MDRQTAQHAQAEQIPEKTIATCPVCSVKLVRLPNGGPLLCSGSCYMLWTTDENGAVSGVATSSRCADCLGPLFHGACPSKRAGFHP